VRRIGDQSIGQERGILGRIGRGGIDPVEGIAAGGGAIGDPERVEYVQRSEE
jgi:hypothetical protein